MALRPRLIDISGRLCVHILSFTISREIATEAGVMYQSGAAGLDKMEGLEFTAVVKYISTGAMQSSDFNAFALQNYIDTKHMDFVNTAPSIPVSVGDLRVDAGEVGLVQVGPVAPGTHALKALFMYTFGGTLYVHAEGMSKESYYIVPGSIGVYSIYTKPRMGRICMWVDQSFWTKAGHTEKGYVSGWYMFFRLGVNPVTKAMVSSLDLPVVKGWSNAQCKSFAASTALFSADEEPTQFWTTADFLYPKRAFGVAAGAQQQVCVSLRNGVVRVCAVNTHHRFLELAEVGDGFWSQVLTAVTTVIRVMKTAVFIAGVVLPVLGKEKQVAGGCVADFEFA